MSSISEFLLSQPIFKVIGRLLFNPCHLRELAKEHGLSASGASDIVRRLKEAGVLREEWKGNKRILSLAVSLDEERMLRNLFRESEKKWAAKRAAKFSKRAKEKLIWMDEAYKFFRKVKKHGNSSSGA